MPTEKETPATWVPGVATEKEAAVAGLTVKLPELPVTEL
jgi:hypothetical protein